MTPQQDLMETVKCMVEERGKPALEKAIAEISNTPYKGGAVSSALKYFAKVTLAKGLPVFPSLISLSCEAVGGEPERTVGVAAALTLIAAAADVHDDIIDQSLMKYSKKTVFGKFGGEVALLTGDALLVLGLNMLHKECEALPKKSGDEIANLTSHAFFEISEGESRETKMKIETEVSPEGFFEVINLKASVPKIHCMIGGLMGNANKGIVEALGRYGEAFGVVSTIREEFIDLTEYSELQNRLRSECLPLPLLCYLKNPRNKKEICSILEKREISKIESNWIAKKVLSSEETTDLLKTMKNYISQGISNLKFVENEEIKNALSILLNALTEDLKN